MVLDPPCSSDDPSAGFDDLLGSGALLKKTIVEGSGAKPDHGAHVFVTWKAYLFTEKGGRGASAVEEVDRDELVIGDEDYRLPGVSLVVRLMHAGERATVRLTSRFGYDAYARPSGVPEGATVELDLELVEAGEDPTPSYLMTSTELVAMANEKRAKGNVHFRAGRTVQASRLYAKAVAFVKDPAKDDGEAKTDVERTVADVERTAAEEAERLETLANCRNNLATAYAKLEEWDRVWDTAKLVLHDRPKDVKALYRLGQVALVRNDLDKAKQYLDEARTLDPSDKVIRRALQSVHTRGKEQRHKEQQLYQRMLGQPPSGQASQAASGQLAATEQPAATAAQSSRRPLQLAVAGVVVAAGVILSLPHWFY